MADGWMIDCDPALGRPFRDIDDALALWSLARAGVTVAGITTTYGNAPLPEVLTVARAVGAELGFPVHRGAARPGDSDTPAVAALVAHRGPVLGLGPCTNLGAALARGARWPQLVVLGGTARLSPNVRYLHLTELNFALDAPAAAATLGHATHLFPMEVCRQVVFTAADLHGLPEAWRRASRSWVALAPWLTGTRGFHPWDVLPALWISTPALFVFEEQRLHVDTRWPWRGVLRGGGGPVAVARHVDAPGVVRRWRSLV